MTGFDVRDSFHYMQDERASAPLVNTTEANHTCQKRTREI